MNACPASFHKKIIAHIKQITTGLQEVNEGISTIMLTGGRSANALYKIWAENPPLEHDKIAYYFGDERSVPPNHPDSNFGMAVSKLFPNGIPANAKIERLRCDNNNLESEAKRYSTLLPESIDILLLSVGPDGHIASIFPGSTMLNEMERAIVPVISPKQPRKRLTITPMVVKTAKNIIVMAEGEEKGRVLARALYEPDNFDELPVRLTIGSYWVLDEAAKRAFEAADRHRHHKTRIIYA